MKKLIITGICIAASSVAGFSQFSEKGYKDLKLGMSIKDAQKLIKFELEQFNPNVSVRYDGLDLELTLRDWDYVGNGESLYHISTSSPKAKIEGIPSELIGKSLKQVKVVLGDKMVEPYPDFAPDTYNYYYLYHRDEDAKNNLDTYCTLIFKNGILNSIATGYRPEKG